MRFTEQTRWTLMQRLFLSMHCAFQLLYILWIHCYIYNSCIKNNVLLREGKATFNKRCVTCSSHNTRLHSREKLHFFVKKAWGCNKPIRKVTHKYHAAINNLPFLIQQHMHNSKQTLHTKNSWVNHPCDGKCFKNIGDGISVSNGSSIESESYCSENITPRLNHTQAATYH